MADDVHHNAERIKREAYAVAEAAAGPERVPVARHFVAVVDVVAGHEAGMVQWMWLSAAWTPPTRPWLVSKQKTPS